MALLSTNSTSKNSDLCQNHRSSFGDQYEKLLQFISASTQSYKSQLAYFIYPIFVQLYLELIVNGAVKEAKEFFTKYSVKFRKSSKSYKEVIDELSAITSPECLEAQPYFKRFRKERFVVKLSTDCVRYLISYLKEKNHIVLLQLLNSYFLLQCDGTAVDLENHCNEPNIPNESIVSQPHNEQDTGHVTTSLEQMIHNVNKRPMCVPSIGMYNIHSGSYRLSSVGFSADYSMAAAGFDESFVCLWNVSSHVKQQSSKHKQHVDITSQGNMLKGHKGPVYGVAFTPRKKHLLSCSSDTTVRAWNVNTGANVAIYQGHNYPIWDISMSKNSCYFATASRDSTARIWTLEQLHPLYICASHTADVNCVRFHPNGNYISTGSDDKTVLLWSVRDGRKVRTFTGHEGSVHSVAFSPDGHMLASAGEDKLIKLWDLDSGLLFEDLRGHEDPIRSICFNADGNLLVSCGVQNSIKVWDISKSISCFKHDRTACKEKIESLVAVSSLQTKSAPQLVSFVRRNIVLAIGVV